MIFFFSTPVRSIIATAADHRLDAEEMKKLCWLYGEATRSKAIGWKGSSSDPAAKW